MRRNLIIIGLDFSLAGAILSWASVYAHELVRYAAVNSLNTKGNPTIEKNPVQKRVETLLVTQSFLLIQTAGNKRQRDGTLA